MHRRPTPLAFTLLLALSASAVHADTTPVPPAKKLPGPGDPLPPFSLDYEDGEITTEWGPHGGRIIASGGVILTYGDLRIRAERIEYTQDGFLIRATGDVIVKRGDESIRGEEFSFAGADGAIDLKNAVALSPPFLLSGARITRQPGVGLTATKARFVPSPDGQGEVAITAQRIEVTDNGDTITFHDMTLFIAGKRMLTLPRLRVPIITDANGGHQAATPQLPVVLRYSGVSGVVLGMDFPLGLPLGIQGHYGAAVTTKTPVQYNLDLRRDLIRVESIGRQRPDSVFYTNPGGMGEERYEGLSPLRQLATARPKPPQPDPILDYETILSNGDPVSHPLQAAVRDLYLAADLIGNRDVGFKRQGPLILSRLPEVSLNGATPLFTRLPQHADNDVLLRFLRTPRLQLLGNVALGHYQEHRLSQDHATVTGDREAYSIGIGMLPLLLGDHLLFRPQITSNTFHYSQPSQSVYRYTESTLTLDYILRAQTIVGATYIRRAQGGTSPFTFDAVDTRDEGQFRGQVALPNSRWTLGSTLRFDMGSGDLFDTELGAAWRGKAIEPRFSFRTLNKQFTFNVNFPGLLR